MMRFDVPRVQMVNFAHVYVEGSAKDWVRLNYDPICLMDWPQFIDAIKAEFGQKLAISECLAEEEKEPALIDYQTRKSSETMKSEASLEEDNSAFVEYATVKGLVEDMDCPTTKERLWLHSLATSLKYSS